MRVRVQRQSIKRAFNKACCRRIASVSSLLELGNLRVVLVNTRNPLNIGAAARAMSNFGVLRLRVVNPFDGAWREARSAVGASPLLAGAEEFTSVADAVADCSLVVGTTAARDRELNHPLRIPSEAAPRIRAHLRIKPRGDSLWLRETWPRQ
jgi:tRNA C32,U32 (ribose-2'-O)-methylase TrmJ